MARDTRAIFEAIRAKLTANAALTAVVPAARIVQQSQRIDLDYPAIVLKDGGADDIPTGSLLSGLVEQSIGVHVYDYDADEVKRIKGLWREAFEAAGALTATGWGRVQAYIANAGLPSFDEGTKLHQDVTTVVATAAPAAS